MSPAAIDITIREWNSSDSVPELSELLHRAYKPLADAGMRFVASYQDDEMTRKRISVGKCFVAEREGVIIGTINYRGPGPADGCAWYERNDVAYFGQFAVEPAFQGSGVGAMLLKHVEHEAASDGASELSFDTSERAHDLIAYYSRRGYRFIQHVQWDTVNYRSMIFSKSLREARDLMSDSAWTTTWRQLRPRDFHSRVRAAAVSAASLALSAAGRVNGLLRRPRVQILLLHHIFDDEAEPFHRLLAALARDHQFISYGDAVKAIASGRIEKPSIAFSFDDGFSNNVLAARILAEFGARACFFVCPSIIGEENEDVIRSFCRDRLHLHAPPLRFMNWKDLESLRDAGHEIGGHTMTHANLARLAESRVREEIAGSYNQIKSRLGEVRHFAWTFGRFEDFSAAAARIAFESGFESCASGMRGAHPPHDLRLTAPPCIRRDHVVAAWPLAHVRYFLAQASRRISAANNRWPAQWPSNPMHLLDAPPPRPTPNSNSPD